MALEISMLTLSPDATELTNLLSDFPEVESTDVAADLAAAALNVPERESIPTREVRLQRKSVCGCFETITDIIRTVPADSPLQDGDFVTDYVDGDRFPE